MVNILAFLVLASPNRDQQVIEAAMLSLFERSSWNCNWTKGDFVMVYPLIAGGSSERSSFSTQSEWLIKWLGEQVEHQVGGEADQKAFKNGISVLQAMDRSDDEHAAKAPDLRTMRFDPRIIVGDYKDVFETKDGGPVKRPSISKIKNRLGQEGTVRASPRLTAPIFSKDGKHAILWTSAWDRACDVVYFLEKGTAKWRVKLAFIIGYL